MDEALEWWNGVGSSFHALGEVYVEKEEYDSALYYFDKSLTILTDKFNFALVLNHIGSVYSDMGDYQKALSYYQYSLEVVRKDQLAQGWQGWLVVSNLLGIASTYENMDNPVTAIKHFKEAEQLTRELGPTSYQSELYEGLASSYEKLSDYTNAFRYQAMLINTLDSLDKIEEANLIEEREFKLELLKNEKENIIESLEQQSAIEKLTIKRQKSINYGIISVGIVLLIVASLLIQRFRYIKRTNIKIRSQRDEIEARRDEIEAQRDEVEVQRDQLKEKSNLLATHRREILDSIAYAERIQSALMPPEQYFHEILNEVFILFKPRDLVSGDFYWTKQVNGFVILAAADCTGHGIPGAFMSMLGMSYLNEIVHKREITTANQILDELRKQIINSLRQYGRPDESRDGIDMALCVIDEKRRTLQYSGANIPLNLIRNINGTPELIEIKADRMPLGYNQGKHKTFTNNDIQLEFGDVFYLFSDGFVDQKGGGDNKKYLSKNFKNLLMEIHEEPMHDQRNILDKTITDWMGDNSQIDDILVVGVRV
jgi:serine phosphatase RsbU (regulator of sigma subunit)